MGDRIDSPNSPTTLTQIKTEPIPHGIRVRHIGSGPQGTFELLGQLTVDAHRLSATLRLDKAPPKRPWFAPRIEHVALGPWSEQAERVYAGCGNVIERPKAFRLAFDGHRLSTSFVGLDFPGGMALVQAVDRGPEALDVDPQSRHYSLQAVGDATRSLLGSMGPATPVVTKRASIRDCTASTATTTWPPKSLPGIRPWSASRLGSMWYASIGSPTT